MSPRAATDDAGAVSGQAATLMARYCGGDAAAFHALYALVAPRLLGYLIGLIGERAAAEDLLQHTFLKLHEARDQYVRGADPVPWIFTIAHRTFLDEARRRQRVRARTVESAPEPEAGLHGGAVEDAPPPGEDGLSQVTLAALATLPEAQREALLLIKVHGHSVAEAAAITGASPSAVKVRAHRGYVALRQLLGGKPREDA